MALKYRIFLLTAVVVGALLTFYVLTLASNDKQVLPEVPKARSHMDHSAYFSTPFKTGSDVTLACLKCHETAADEVMNTSHWNWEGPPVEIAGHQDKRRIGKKNLINNFCIAIEGNWPSCTRCHAGYGWSDNKFNFKDSSNVDCLACHDRSGQYRKGKSGYPEPDTDLQAAAQSVGFPKRENCGLCHFYGGGGLGVKHGDLDNSLENASAETDVHMGRGNLLCIDCHRTEKHDIKGVAFSVSVNHDNGIGCTDCHKGELHKDPRLNRHLKSVACQTCHIPSFADRVPTKMDWDWSKAGDDSRPDNVHEYLKIKGEFVYDQSVKPEYAWFNLNVDRYLIGDKMNPEKELVLNRPHGDIHDQNAKIWPFKVHRGKQPYDKVHNYLLSPVTAGDGGFWWEFNWDKAFRMGAERTGLPYSGEYGFAKTVMYWPISHMVRSADQALTCTECHSQGGRMNWNALGYSNDPMLTGGRQ